MSSQNLQTARKANAALNAGDFDALVEFFAPDCVLLDLQNAPDQRATVEGAEAIRKTLTLWAGAFDELRADISEYVELGDSVICAARWHGHGKGSGISIDTHQFDLYTLRDGKVVRAILGFRSKQAALEAAGAEN
jgi:ketosteroid isomerase-like protein